MLPLLVFILNVVLILVLEQKEIDEYWLDKVLHLVGGASICLSAAGVVWHLARLEIILLQDIRVFRALVFGFVCFTVISWEILEYFVEFRPESLTYTDTITDMISGLIGGSLGALTVLKRPNAFNVAPTEQLPYEYINR